MTIKFSRKPGGTIHAIHVESGTEFYAHATYGKTNEEEAKRLLTEKFHSLGLE